MVCILAIFLYLAAHEGGHFLLALAFGKVIRFRFEWGYLGKFPIPRGIWDMPDLKRWQQKVIALAGFGAEFLFAILLTFLCPERWYLFVPAALAHLIAYPFYAGAASDFRWLQK